ncbi:glycosyltransferase family 2 protein [Candidatus Methylocalor cossyra]|uniref:Glycosyl transferase family 2 n=1 Tax=Candidatus Methylocalor cossyra TaxID=3108543 RepID=A0ABM9NIB8_9GAMM
MTRSDPEFTLFIPTYNRAKLLPRALASIEAQTCRDFEVVIVDDGSTDDTAAVVAAWRTRVDFPVVYVRQPNRGKYAAHNVGVERARGRFFVLLDSDDRLLPDTLERIRRHWHSIPEGERWRFAGVEGLVESMDGKRLLTEPYPQSPLDISYLDLFYRLGVGGDKKHAIRTEILRRFPYPIFPGETNIRDSITWNRIAHHYIFRCVNEPFQQVEYQPDGLTSNRFRVRMGSPRGFQQFHLEEITLHRPWLSRRQLRRSTIAFIRFSLHLRVGFWQQARLTGYDPLWLMLLPAGLLRWLVDCYRLRFQDAAPPNRVPIRN